METIIYASDQFDLKAINPKDGDKFSPNLYRFMRSRKGDRGMFELYREKSTGYLYLGYGDDENWFYGVMLNRVLCLGSQAQVFAHPKGHNFEHVPGFWAEYRKIGRCAIDKEHDTYFAGDCNRWLYRDADRRTCNWCGFRQERKERIVTKTISEWVQTA